MKICFRCQLVCRPCMNEKGLAPLISRVGTAPILVREALVSTREDHTPSAEGAKGRGALVRRVLMRES